MIVYAATKSEFISDVCNNRIEEAIHSAYKRHLGHSTSQSEIDSWKNSMMYMNNILLDKDIPGDAGVAIEYQVPQTSKRIDFILTGKDREKRSTAVIVELKQWSEAKITAKDALVTTYLGTGEQEVAHPSYQAWTYAALLEDFNEAVQKQGIKIRPCAYLHNMATAQAIKHPFYAEHIRRAPVFIRTDTEQLTDFIKQFVKYGDAGRTMYEIDHGKIRPSKSLADKLLSLLQGNQEFLMIDDQKLVFETALELARKSTVKDKNILVVEGGPGTGKSVVAVNLLVELTNLRLVAKYVTKNAAPRTVYESKLTGTYTKTHIGNLFSGSGSFTDCEENIFDVLIVDEAHRLNEKSGMFQNLGENQIKEIIHSSKFSVFFIDEDQRVTFKDIGEKQEIEKWARRFGAKVHSLELQSQFRCNGSDGYLAWVDNALQIKETANETLEGLNYDFQVFDSPNNLREAIFRKNQINNKARLVAGYCWNWISKRDNRPGVKDIVIEKYDFTMQWNLASDGNLWILKPESVSEVGCIHTCQGLELDYIGVIIGPDLIVQDGKVITDAEERARTDSSIKGYKKLFKAEPDKARAKAERIIKNTYRTLMTRGVKGCYVFCTDRETNEYFKSLSNKNFTPQLGISPEDSTVRVEKKNSYPGLHLQVLQPNEIKPFENAVPIYDLKAAAGQFSHEQIIDEVSGTDINNPEDYDWVELPDIFRPQQGLFVAQVVGESMNRRIPNGAWCLFRLNPAGTRNGKVVLVQHRNIQDPDTGGQYTVKVYQSDKGVGEDGYWVHNAIWLNPDSTIPYYEPMVFNGDSCGDLKVIAELIAVLG
jgi:hypothetical protein